jgi:hypothetical protein
VMIGEKMSRRSEVIGWKRRALGLQAGQSPKVNAMMARINLRRLLKRESGR